MVMGFVLLQPVGTGNASFRRARFIESTALEQTTRLVEESTLRAKAEAAHATAESARAAAEHRLRLEAESKITLFSEVTHHLNNPLSHIQGEILSIQRGTSKVQETLYELLPEDSDSETAARAYFEQGFNEMNESHESIESARVRATDAIELLRRVSGVDGIPMEPTSVQEVFGALHQRGDLQLSDFDLSEIESRGSLLLIGHALVYGYLLRQVFGLIQTEFSRNDERVEMSKLRTLTRENPRMLDIVIPLNCDLTESEEVDFRENLEPMDYLAQAMHGAVYFSDESWSVVVCLLAHYPEERV